MTEIKQGSGSAKKFAGIEIPSELTWSNFFNLYLATFFVSCLLVLPAVVQPALLKEVINIPDEQAGSINAGLTGANTLVSDVSPKNLLGSILGGLNSMRLIGVLFFHQVGGFLFDNVGYGAPFLLKGIASVVCGLWIFAVRKNV